MDSTDPSEPDLAWRGYSGWTLLPSSVVCIALSVLLLTGSWFFDDIRRIGREFGSLIYFQLTVAIWIVQLSRLFYRGSMYVYRLTPRFLFIDRGFLYNPDPRVDLTKVAHVISGGNMLNRLVGVGWVEIVAMGGAAVKLTGITRPAEFVKEIESAVGKAKAASG